MLQAAGDVLVGQAVKAIAAHADVRDGTRQGEPSGNRRQGVMKRRVEACDLRERGTGCGNRVHRREIIRHMQRIERRQSLQRRQQRWRDQLRCNMSGTAMHDAVADGCQPVATKMRVGKREQCVEEGGERRRGTCRPAFLGQNIPVGITSEHMRSRVQVLDLTAHGCLQLASVSNRANFMLDEPALSVRIDPFMLIPRSRPVLSARPARRMPGKCVYYRRGCAE